jgi:hypothetical protein
MSFVFAFLIGGVICALGQIFAELKIPAPVSLAAFIAIGGILTPLNVMGFLLSLGAGGVSVMACGLGNAGFDTGALLALGNPAPLATVLALLVVLIGLGSLCGLLTGRRQS